jgi:hypothetical protein
MLKDRDIREPLFDFLEERLGKLRIIEEKTMGRSRADIVMVLPKALVGIEIKSDADSYTRLESQVKDYDSYFDYNYVVVGSSHGAHIGEHVPEHWGMISVEETEDGTLDFYVLREAAPNPDVDPLHKLALLWRPELVHIQEKNGMPKYANQSKAFVQKKILEQVSEELFERDYTTIRETINAYRVAKGQKPRRKKKKRQMKAPK